MTDGARPVRLDDGAAFGISPDGKWVTGYSSRDTKERKYVLMPDRRRRAFSPDMHSFRKKFGIVLGWLAGDGNYLVGGAVDEQQVAVVRVESRDRRSASCVGGRHGRRSSAGRAGRQASANAAPLARLACLQRGHRRMHSDPRPLEARPAGRAGAPTTAPPMSRCTTTRIAR